MKIKKTMKYLATLILVGFIIFCCYAQYKKSQFDKIYTRRESEYIYHKYDTLYNSGALNHFKKFIVKNYDTLSILYEFNRHKKIKIYSELLKHTKDSTDIQAIKEIVGNRFYDVYIEKNEHTNNIIKITFENTFLEYKTIPTYHVIYYSTKGGGTAHRIAPNDDWYFYTDDDMQYDDGLHFDLDFRPEWLIPYYEAFDFFKCYPDYSIDK